jgi:hypothetical protein
LNVYGSESSVRGSGHGSESSVHYGHEIGVVSVTRMRNIQQHLLSGPRCFIAQTLHGDLVNWVLDEGLY